MEVVDGGARMFFLLKTNQTYACQGHEYIRVKMLCAVQCALSDHLLRVSFLGFKF